jgi:cytochrome oxidase Cu insertion factor (SCO1/SenC/PrrC family)
MAGWPFPVFSLSFLLSFTVISGLVLLIPSGASPVGQFADAFRVWCFGFDPATGEFEMAYVAMLFANPLLLAAILFAVWNGELRRGVRENGRGVRRVAGAGIATTLVAAGAFTMLDAPVSSAELPFPAEDLRTAYEAPDFRLESHRGGELALSDFADKVVVLTSIYSCCPTACPLILQQAQRVIASLGEAERSEVVVLAISMDPERDTPEALATMARAHGVDPEVFHLLTGDADTTFAALDRLGIERRTDPDTGLIDHTSVFLLVDRGGRIAYRFAMGEQQERWFSTALRMLIAEPEPNT